MVKTNRTDLLLLRKNNKSSTQICETTTTNALIFSQYYISLNTILLFLFLIIHLMCRCWHINYIYINYIIQIVHDNLSSKKLKSQQLQQRHFPSQKMNQFQWSVQKRKKILLNENILEQCHVEIMSSCKLSGADTTIQPAIQPAHCRNDKASSSIC